MTLIELYDRDNETVGSLQASVQDIVVEAEEHARKNGLAKRSCFPKLLRQHIEAAGWRIEDHDVEVGVAQFDSVRRGQASTSIRLNVRPMGFAKSTDRPKGEKMTPKNTPATGFFERERVYPDAEAKAWYDRLVGLEDHKNRLLVELELLLYPERLAEWSRRYHGSRLQLCELLTTRAPLILLEAAFQPDAAGDHNALNDARAQAKMFEKMLATKRHSSP